MRSLWQALRLYQEQASRYLRPQEEQALDLAVDLLMEQEIRELARETVRASWRIALLVPSETVSPETSEMASAEELSSQGTPETLNALAVLYLRFQDSMGRRERLALEAALDLMRQRVAGQIS